MVPRVGQRIGPYEILGRLGSGGMGLVFSAWDARLQRDVAIKLLREEYSSPDMRSRFLQEARAASGLNHPNICTIFDIGEQGGDPYLVMELLKGETLRARIASGSISAEDIVLVAAEVADALTVAHARGIIHRDIKPANIILVDKHGGRFGTKVLDFGLAKVDLGEGVDTRFDLTSMGSTVGTVSYMSPEQARGEPLDSRSDLFSLGVVLYEMATGQVPFRGATSALVFVQLLSHPPEGVREINAAIPRDLERIIVRLLEKDRSHRFQSAAELAETLHRLSMKWPSVGKSLWGAIPSLVRPKSDSSTARDQANASVVEPKKPIEPEHSPVRATPVGESMLRPVRRVVSSDPAFSPKVKTPSEPVVPPAQAAVVAASNGTAAVVPEAAPAVLTDRHSEPFLPTHPPPSLIQLPRAAALMPSPRFHPIEDDYDAEEKVTPLSLRLPRIDKRKSGWLLVAAIALVIAAALWIFWPRQGGAAPNQPSTLVLASLSNRTGDDILSGVLLAGLQFDLQQSKRLAVRDATALGMSFRPTDTTSDSDSAIADARQKAQVLGGKDLLFGDVKMSGSAYVVTLRVYEVATGAKIVNVSETSVSREQLADAIDRLASEVRSGLGENGDSIGKNAVPLSKEATSNLDALQDYVAGQGLMSTGHLIDAMHSFERATVADPHFTQAYLQLADLYRRQRAPLASVEAATRAQNNSLAAGERTQLLAQASYAMNASGDYPRAVVLLQQVLSAYPADVDANVQGAITLRLQGKFSESLETSQRALRQIPNDLDAAGAAETAMLALDRPEAAAQMEAQVARTGRNHPGLRVLINYLSSRDDGQVGIDVSDQSDRFAPQQYQAEVMDAGGLLAGGLQMWRALAGQASANQELLSAANAELAVAALDRALTGDCVTAQSLLNDASAYGAGLDGVFNMGMTAALCGDLNKARANLDLLQQNYPQSFAAKGFYAADLAAVIQWKNGDSAGALKTLGTAKQYDPISLTPYLRALIRLKSGQPQAAIVDFQAILGHRGATTLTNPVLFALAQFGLARAYQASGDEANSATAYSKFLGLWSAADSGQEMVKEAHLHAH